MFEAEITGSRLARVVEVANAIVEEARVHLDEDGIRIRAVDPANVAMVDLTAAAAMFETYEADGGVIGLNLSRLDDVAGMAGADTLVAFELDEETRKLRIEAESLEYTMSLIDPDAIRQEPDFPDLDLPARVIVEGREIGRGVKAADMVSDHIRMSVDDESEEFVIDAEGDTDDIHMEMNSDTLLDLRAAPADSLYSLDYFKDMNRVFEGDTEVEFELGEEFPMKAHFGIGDGDDGGDAESRATYMLAPRIQSS